MFDGTRINGACDPAFEMVKAEFTRNFTERGELGAAVCVTLDGEVVVDLWAGWADEERRRPWQSGTLTNVWSAGKGVTAIVAHRLADQGELDLDAPVAAYWPEFGAAGKQDIPVRWVLSHRSGVCGVDLDHPLRVSDLYDWERMTSLLAVQEPFFQPGSVSGYGALSYGYLVGEIVRRATGSTIDVLCAENVAGAVGADFHLGLSAGDLERCSEMVEPEPDPELESALAAAFASAGPAAQAALLNPRPLGRHANASEWRRAVIPSAGAHATARALATIYGALADGSEKLLSTPALDRARAGQGRCVDVVAGVGGEFALGFTLGSDEHSFGPNRLAFGHDGFGGSTGYADPESGIGMGYVMNRMGPLLRDDPRKMALVNAVHGSLADR
ncbi:serine hydrolase domain-containing protein [Streptomyces sp. TS71-3]|uniref:serine hydrolase domain-containing protein n=1 Tax=Streptomyces sp. TS71-3 TaxID=2733862 RepID=UPI001BB36BA6|nr:serine hydrolase domain-containing protein [Streptomyces sp. TS71-3]